jgi:hypothetical protein
MKTDNHLHPLFVVPDEPREFAPKGPKQISPGQRPHRYPQIVRRIDHLGLVGKRALVNLVSCAQRWKTA